ncbi:MAG: hypothetical protein P8R39_10000 [Alphaproteobacteria bacterium]|jgi:hypothetical protein|nr:hypothetical protein [Alphaproteobacteria bacterium]
MTQTTKIATCGYCGARAALVLTQQARHELTCSACGAPLDDVEVLQTAVRTAPPADQPTTSKEAKSRTAQPRAAQPRAAVMPWMESREKVNTDDDDDDDDDDKDRRKASKRSKKSKRRKRRKSLVQRFFDEAADAIEDIFDD